MALLLSVQASADPAPAPGPAPDEPAATSVCGDPSSVISGVTLTSMGACDPDGCPRPTMDNAYCCCEETGSLMIHIVNTGTVTIGGFGKLDNIGTVTFNG